MLPGLFDAGGDRRACALEMEQADEKRVETRCLPSTYDVSRVLLLRFPFPLSLCGTRLLLRRKDEQVFIGWTELQQG